MQLEKREAKRYGIYLVKTSWEIVQYTNPVLHNTSQVLQVLEGMDSNVADPRRNGHIGKVFELAEPCFNCNMERDFRITAIFPCRDWNRISNPCNSRKAMLRRIRDLDSLDC